MKRPPGLWCLLVIATFWLCVQDVDSLRATALILGKSPSTTTTTTEAPQEIDSGEGVTEAGAADESQNVTKHVLTGIPQIDYIWDPNLPRELNGYNLSEYPFYHRVPEDINFKCDGLHDGFYASVPHKCQVYHHCLFGIRYDFLCANYTAFDQKTFICHFVSEVDCLNSKKFWHRNDALYKAVSTTTVKPAVVYTLPPPSGTSVPITSILNRRPGSTGAGGGLRSRRPFRRRPQYDYYEDEYADEEYEERPVRKRPRYRPRPVYEDDYEYYEDEAYSKRRPSRRRPYERRGETRRNKEERRRYEDEYDDARDDPDDDRRDDKRTDEEPRRRPSTSSRNRSRPSKRRPADDEDYERRYERPKKRTRRPVEEEDYEDEPPARRSNERKKNKNRDQEADKEVEDRSKKANKNEGRNTRTEGRNNRNEETDDKSKSKVKNDVSTEEPPLTKAPLSVYERKRPPKIRPPVPLNEQNKYVPKTTTLAPLDDEEYYDDYEEEEPVRESKRKLERKPIKEPPKRIFGVKQKNPENEDEEPVRSTTKRPQISFKDRRIGSGTRRKPIVEEYDDYEEKSSKSTSEEPQTTTTTTKELIKEKHEPIIKVVKRPFLPSRGGNPYSARGLLPVGLKSVDESTTKEEQKVESQKPQEAKEENQRQQPLEEVRITKPLLKLRNKFNDDDFKPITNRPVSRINIVKITTTTTSTTTTTEKPVEKNPLDLDENEYDVTLNDALNPTIPNLPVRNFPTGFSSQNDYNYNTVQRSRYVADPTLNQASSDYVYRIEPLQSRYVPLYQPYRQTPRQHHQTFYAGY